MRDDDELIAAYERELVEDLDAFEGESSPRSRGFFIVAGALGLGCVLLVVQILANRPLAETIAHGQHTLRAAQAEAERILQRTGSFAAAGAGELGVAGEPLTFREADQPSIGLNDVSVYASATVWAAAVRARPGACFYLKLAVDDDPRYGVGVRCTGLEAIGSSEPRW
jgi:hypothetical protein